MISRYYIGSSEVEKAYLGKLAINMGGDYPTAPYTEFTLDAFDNYSAGANSFIIRVSIPEGYWKITDESNRIVASSNSTPVEGYYVSDIDEYSNIFVHINGVRNTTRKLQVHGTLGNVHIISNTENDVVAGLVTVHNISTDIDKFYISTKNYDVIMESQLPKHMTTTRGMFENCHLASSINVSHFDMSRVDDAAMMFSRCYNYNAPMGDWDTSKFRTLFFMFQDCYKMNQDLNNWDVSSVTDFTGTFFRCYKFNSDLDMWDTSSGRLMESTFSNNAEFDGNITTWDMGNVTTMKFMLIGCPVFNQDIGGWDVSKVVDMTSALNTTDIFNQDISGWNTSSVIGMNYTLAGALLFNQDLSKWCVTRVANASGFSNVTPAWTLPKPVWGTCPRGENLLS